MLNDKNENINNLLKEVQRLLLHGLGRRSIAKELGITQWHARQLIEKIKSGEYRDLYFKKENVPNKITKVSIDNSNNLSKKTDIRIGAPNISVKAQPSAIDDFLEIKTYPVGLKVAVLSDIHLPYEDTKAVELTKAFLKDWDPDMIILNGDICDFYQVSSYDKENKNRPSFQEEITYSNQWLGRLVDEFPKTEIKMTEGNHCNRLSRYLTKNAASLKDLHALSIDSLLGLREKGIEWITGDKDIQIGDLMIMHGQSSRKDAGSSVKHHYSMYGSSILIGHIHRGSIAYKRTKQGISTLIENPCLCDLSVDYCRFPDWVQGFTTLVFSGNMFSAQTRLIQNYTLITDSKVYTA